MTAAAPHLTLTTGLPEIDPALVRAAQRGDPIAETDFLDALARMWAGCAAHIALQDRPDAAQEALIAIFRNIGGLREPDAIYGWARAIAVREAVRVARTAARAVPGRIRGCPRRGSKASRRQLRRAVPPPRTDAVLVLRDLDGLPEQAVGALLDGPAATVRSRLFWAGRSFRKAWLP